jgi:hypothetical protein
MHGQCMANALPVNFRSSLPAPNPDEAEAAGRGLALGDILCLSPGSSTLERIREFD